MKIKFRWLTGLVTAFAIGAVCCFPATTSIADEYEWDVSSGYHEEEWYDPSDWFDPDDGIDYEDDYFGSYYDGGYYNEDYYDGNSTWYGDNYYSEDWYGDESDFDDWYEDDTYLDDDVDGFDLSDEFYE